MKDDPTTQLIKPKSKVTQAQKKLFANKYLEEWSIGSASAYAGISVELGKRLIHKDPTIKSIISKNVTKKLSGMDIDNQKILAKFVEIAFHPDPQSANIKTSDQLRALEMLGKANGLFDQPEDKERSIPKVEVVITSDKQPEQQGLVAPTQPLRIN